MNQPKEKQEEYLMQFKNKHIQVKLKNRKKSELHLKNNNHKVKFNSRLMLKYNKNLLLNFH